MSKKSQKNGRNHKKTGEKRAISPKRPFKRACPFKNGRLSNTGMITQQTWYTKNVKLEYELPD